MAKKMVLCPECGHKHTVQFNTVKKAVVGIRSKRLTGNQFQYAAVMPDFLMDQEEDVEKFYSISEQALMAGLVGLGAGTTIGFFVSQVFPVEYSLQIIPGAALIGMTASLSILAAERNCMLRKAIPWFVGVAGKLKPESQTNDEVTLTVDHRYRDGNTEAGRTVNRFGTLPVDLNRFNGWAQDALIGKSLAVGKWTGSGKTFTRDEYNLLLEKMRDGEIVVNLGSNKGNTLTIGGKRALTRHLSDCGITPPSPANDKDFLGERLAQAQANNGGNTPLPRSDVCVGGENEG